MGTAPLRGPKPSVSGPNYFGRGWKQKGSGRNRGDVPTLPRCPCPAPHLWLLLPFDFVLSAPFLTFGVWGCPAAQGEGQQGHRWSLRDRPRPCAPVLGQSPQRGVPVGKDSGCCHRRAQSPSDTPPVGTVPPTPDPPGLGETSWEKGAFHQNPAWLPPPPLFGGSLPLLPFQGLQQRSCRSLERLFPGK